MADIFELFKQISGDPAPSGPVTHIVAGLGNPGEQYTFNRHNVGFLCMDYLSQKRNVRINRIRFHALCGECTIAGKHVLVMKPQTYMNNSGEAVREAADFYKVPPANVIVLYDDISLDPGRMRVRLKGSAGGHNGIKSIIANLGSDEFPRVKLGVGSPPEGFELVDWVLGDVPKDSREALYACIEKANDSLEFLINGEGEKAMQLFNGK